MNGGVHIAKRQTNQRYILKLHSSRLRKEKWKLTLPLADARRNDEIISLADSQILRWIDEINSSFITDTAANEIRSEIRRLRKEPNTLQNRRSVRQLYSRLDDVLYKPDYMCLIIDKAKDYERACKGFTINGIKYKRLLGTSGGIKNSTIVFVSDRVHGELKRRIDNGRDETKELVAAKLEAYKSLTCSASTPVSMPNGVLVINDAKTTFLSDVIYLSDESDGEPQMELRKDAEIMLDATDGCGMMSPTLAERWSAELGLDYIASGMNTRYAFEKGMVFPFDFREFAERYGDGYLVRDAWGNDADIRNVELVLTTSMVKLWDCYENIDDYLSKSAENHYSFCITKVAPKKLESERNLNYQFIQPYELSDEDIDELIGPTLQDIGDVLHGDWRKTVLFLRGVGLNDSNVCSGDDDFAKAIMADKRMLDDPFIQSCVYQLIRKRIDGAKVGQIHVHGNYSIASGDLFLLCQSMFGLEITGLLKAGEVYNRYWRDCGAERLACFRAPMTCYNNIRSVVPRIDEKTAYWFRYMDTVTVFNGWDTAMIALNGMDFDGDLVMLTDNDVLVRNLIETPAILCHQRNAKKKIPDEEDFIQSNIESFGNGIGVITNRVTSMYEIRAGFEPGSAEYKTLTYRIRCGQLLQQNEIDKAKGIVSKPMPKEWYDKHTANKIDNETERGFYRELVAERKPYFMRYIYPALMHQYNTYIKNTNKNALREFGVDIDSLYAMRERTDRQNDFLYYYACRMPVGMSDCVMNKICRRFEEAFDGYVGKTSGTQFDYSIMKSSAEYTRSQFDAVRKIYDEYIRQLRTYAAYTNRERVDEDESFQALSNMNELFLRSCTEACQNEAALCNIVLDLCYKKSKTKRFAWSMCGGQIIENLLNNSGRLLSYPEEDESGDIEYRGRRFAVHAKYIEEECYVNCSE